MGWGFDQIDIYDVSDEVVAAANYDLKTDFGPIFDPLPFGFQVPVSTDAGDFFVIPTIFFGSFVAQLKEPEECPPGTIGTFPDCELEECPPGTTVSTLEHCVPIPVGGEFLGVDSTALLLTGAQLNAAWMIPVIVSGIGFAIVIARKF